MKTSTFRALLVGAVVGVGASFVSCGTPACSATSCIGCCAADGTCKTGNEAPACGAAGGQCLTCVTGQVCLAGACVSSGSGGGSGTGGGTAGGAGGGTGGGTAGSAGGGSAGGHGGGAAGGQQAPSITVNFMTTCPSFTPCGGGLTGTWFYTQACVDDAAFDAVAGPLMNAGCNNVVVSNKTGTVSGAVVFTSTSVTRTVTGAVNFRVEGESTQCVSLCSVISQGLSTYGVTGSCAAVAADGGTPAKCRCDLSAPFNTGGTDTYTSANNAISLTPSNRTYSYCVNPSGSSFNYIDTTQSSGNVRPDPGTFVLTKQ